MSDDTSNNLRNPDRGGAPTDFVALAHKDNLECHEVLSVLRIRTSPTKSTWEGAQELGIGSYGIFEVTKDGIRSVPVSADELSALFPSEQRVILEAEHSLRLDFPCAPAGLVALVGACGEFVLPDDFVEIVQSGKRHTASAEKRCLQWLTELFRSDGAIPPKNQLWSEASTKFPSLSKRAYIRAREGAIKASGNKDLVLPGRRSKKS